MGSTGQIITSQRPDSIDRIQDIISEYVELSILSKSSSNRRLDRPTLPPPIYFNEFHVQAELPFAPSHDFYGRVHVLKSIQEDLNPGTLKKNHRYDRTVVILQGIGGIGKTQTALQYVRRNGDIYSTVFWVDISNPSTIAVSSKQIMDKLICHYAKKYPGEQNFGSIATDLEIPGQIDNQGLLTGNAAESPWQCVRKWLARDANTRWCLVVDGINNEADGDSLLKFFPACDHGHIIGTSTIRVSNFKTIEIPELEEESSVELLLHNLDSATDKEEGISPYSSPLFLGITV